MSNWRVGYEVSDWLGLRGGDQWGRGEAEGGVGSHREAREGPALALAWLRLGEVGMEAEVLGIGPRGSLAVWVAGGSRRGRASIGLPFKILLSLCLSSHVFLSAPSLACFSSLSFSVPFLYYFF